MAFRQNEGRESDGIFTALVGGENPTRLTSHSGDFGPAWSPDSRQIAFIRYSDNSLSVNIVPAFGGVEREVYSMPAALGEGLTWSKTGKAVAFTESTIVNPSTLVDCDVFAFGFHDAAVNVSPGWVSGHRTRFLSGRFESRLSPI